MADPVGLLVTVLLAFLMIYVGFEVLYSVNPLLAVVFVLASLYLIFKSVGGGRGR
jgi:purine-cytosine permease-like protein